jgi:endonuclease YncB( thermonuclease family)
MIRFARICSPNRSRNRIAVLAFSVGLAGGVAIGLTMQSRPAPAAAEPASVSDNAIRPSGPAPAPVAAIPADVLRVIDGDTFEARVHVWPGLDITTKVRLRGIDAAELRARCPAERTVAEAARDALGEMLAEGAVGVFSVSLDKYGGRVVANAKTRPVANVSTELLERGYARRYAGGHRDGWCNGQP